MMDIFFYLSDESLKTGFTLISSLKEASLFIFQVPLRILDFFAPISFTVHSTVKLILLPILKLISRALANYNNPRMKKLIEKEIVTIKGTI